MHEVLSQLFQYCNLYSMALRHMKLLFATCAVFVTAPLVDGQCEDAVGKIAGRNGEIRAPNLMSGTEYGKAANCSWNFSPENGMDFALVLTVKELRLYVVKSSTRHCLGSYNLTLNNEQLECDRYAIEKSDGTETVSSSFCKAYYSSPTCTNMSQIQNCSSSQKTSYPVSMTYFSDGRIENDTDVTSKNMYFKIAYEFFKCPGAERTTTTTTKPTASTEDSIPTTVAPATTELVPSSSVMSTGLRDPTSPNTEIPASPTGGSTEPSTSTWATSSRTTGSSATTTKANGGSQMIIIIAASAGGGVVILIFVIVLVVCLCKRGGKDEDQTIPLDDITTGINQSDGATYDTLGGATGANQSDGATYDTLGGAIGTSQSRVTGVSQSKVATYDSLNVAGATNQSRNETYNRLGGAVQTNQSKEPAGAAGTSMYTTVDLAAETNQSEPELYSTVLTHPEVAPSVTSQEEGALYSAVSIRKRGEKETVHYKKTTVDNVLYGTTDHTA